jgi:hypothetical protein
VLVVVACNIWWLSLANPLLGAHVLGLGEGILLLLLVLFSFSS